MTWSIVTFDADTGAFAVAVATRNFAVGATVPHLRAGIGAVATQSISNRYLGSRVLDAMAAGLSPTSRWRRPWPVTKGGVCGSCTRLTGTRARRPGRVRTA